MKNQFILMAAAALAFASCSKDEMTEVNSGNAIGFRTAVTRAAETTTGNLSSIKVTALYTNPAASQENVNYFSSQEFTKQADSWTSTPTYFWPATGTMTFYAWAPSDLAPTISGTSKTFAFTPNAAVASQVDFIAAKSDPTTCSTSQSSVGLTFKHALSQIVVQAKNTNSGYTYKVYGVRIGKVAMSGTYDFDGNGNSWTPVSEGKGKYEISYDGNPVTLNATAASIMDGTGAGTNNLAAMLIPQTTEKWDTSVTGESNTNSYISVKVQITSATGTQIFPTDGTSAGWVAVPVAFNWVEGNKYTYVLDFSNGAGKVDPDEPNNPGTDVLGGAINFNVTVSDWGNQTNGTGVDVSNGTTSDVQVPEQNGGSN